MSRRSRLISNSCSVWRSPTSSLSTWQLQLRQRQRQRTNERQMVQTRSSTSSRVPFSAINALTFHSDRQTSSRRTAPVRELTCQGSGCELYEPDVVQCTVAGSDGSPQGTQWRCEAQLPRSVRMGAVEVSCEGYDSPDDPYVLRGSCGLTYSLHKAPPAFMEDGYAPPSTRRDYLSSSSDDDTDYLSIPHLVSYAIVAYIVWVALKTLCGSNAAARTPRAPRDWSGFFGGGGGGDGPGFGGGRPGDSPPPPYSKEVPPGQQQQRQAQGGGRWQPGFWTGLATGAAALGASNWLRGGDRAGGRERYRPAYGAQTYGPAAGRAGMGGGRARGWDSNPYDVGTSRSAGVSSSSSSDLRPSSGFGGTRNR